MFSRRRRHRHSTVVVVVARWRHVRAAILAPPLRRAMTSAGRVSSASIVPMPSARRRCEPSIGITDRCFALDPPDTVALVVNESAGRWVGRSRFPRDECFGRRSVFVTGPSCGSGVKCDRVTGAVMRAPVAMLAESAAVASPSAAAAGLRGGSAAVPAALHIMNIGQNACHI